MANWPRTCCFSTSSVWRQLWACKTRSEDKRKWVVIKLSGKIKGKVVACGNLRGSKLMKVCTRIRDHEDRGPIDKATCHGKQTRFINSVCRRWRVTLWTYLFQIYWWIHMQNIFSKYMFLIRSFLFKNCDVKISYDTWNDCWWRW